MPRQPSQIIACAAAEAIAQWRGIDAATYRGQLDAGLQTLAADIDDFLYQSGVFGLTPLVMSIIRAHLSPVIALQASGQPAEALATLYTLLGGEESFR